MLINTQFNINDFLKIFLIFFICLRVVFPFVEPAHVFTVNDHFTSKLFRVKIQTGQYKSWHQVNKSSTCAVLIQFQQNFTKVYIYLV